MDVNPNDPNPAGAVKTEEQKTETIDVSKWLNRIKESEKYMRDKFKPRWDLARKRLRSEVETKKLKGDKPTHEHVAMLLSVCTNYINSVYFKNPNVNLTARNDEETEKVENTEIQINDFFKDKKVKKTIKRIVQDAFTGGFGARYLDYEYRDFEGTEPAMDESGQPMMNVDPNTGQEVPIMERIKVSNQPVLQRIRPDLVRFPRGFDFDTFQDSPWIGFDLLQPVDEVKANKDFDQGLTALINGSKFDDISDKESKRTVSSDSDIKWTRLHYVFEKPLQDGMSFKMYVFCEEVKDAPLRVMDYDKGCIGYPIKFLYHNPLDDDESYPCGDAWNMESQLAAIDTWWRTLVNHVKRSLPKRLYDKNKIKGVDLQNLKKTDDLGYCGLDPQGGPLELLVKDLESAQIHPDTNLLYTSARSIISEIGPKSGLGRGNETESTGTATGDKIIQSNEMIDLDGRIDDIREFIIDLVLDLAGLFENNYQGIAEINGTLSDGREIQRQVDKSGFTSKINADVDIESMQAPNREIYRRQLMDAFATMKMFEQALAKKKKALDGEWVAKKIADNFGIRNFDKAIIDLNIRDAGQETLDAIFKGIPLAVQNGEVYQDHLRNHMQTLNDQIQMQLFEQMKPGFTEELNNHVLETTDAMKAQQQMQNPKSKTGMMPKGNRPMMATELSRANQV